MNRRFSEIAAIFSAALLLPLSGQAQLAPAAEAPLPPSAPPQTEEAEIPAQDAKVENAGETSAAPSPDDYLSSSLNRPGGLTSDEAARKAADYSRDAVIAQEDYRYAKARKRETVYNYLPRLTLTASYTRQSVPSIYKNRSMGNLVATTSPAGPLTATDPLFAVDGSAFNFSPLSNNWYLNAGLIVPISDYVLNLSSAINGANAATDAAQLNEKAARLNAAANARLAYYDWVRSKLRVKEAQKALERAQAQLENLSNLAEAGRVAQVDVLRQKAYVASAELDVQRSQTAEVIARQSLHELMTGGEGKLPHWEIGEDILASKSRGDVALAELNALQKEAAASRLEVQAMEQSAAALDDQSSVYRSRGYPRVEAFGNATYANPNSRYIPPRDQWNASWDVGVRAVWTVNDLGVQTSAAESSDAEAAKVRAQRQQLIDALKSEVLSSYRMVQEARQARQSARQGVLAAEAAYQDRLQLFENGRGTTLDVLLAETSLVTARMNLIDAHIAMRQAQVRLDHAVGRDAKDLGF